MSHAQTHMTTYYPPTVTVEVRGDAMFVELARKEGAFTNCVVLSGPPDSVVALCRKVLDYAEIAAGMRVDPDEPDTDAAAADAGALA